MIRTLTYQRTPFKLTYYVKQRLNEVNFSNQYTCIPGPSSSFLLLSSSGTFHVTTFFSYCTIGPILTNFGTKHPQMHGIQVCLKEGPMKPFSKESKIKATCRNSYALNNVSLPLHKASLGKVFFFFQRLHPFPTKVNGERIKIYRQST